MRPTTYAERAERRRARPRQAPMPAPDTCPGCLCAIHPNWRDAHAACLVTLNLP